MEFNVGHFVFINFHINVNAVTTKWITVMVSCIWIFYFTKINWIA